MASHHHHHCHNPTMAATAAPFCQCTCTYSPIHHHHPPLLPDPHYINHNHYHHSPSPDLHHQLYTSQTHLPNLHQYDACLGKRVFQEETQINPTISSLVRRIAALESALIHRSSSSSRPLRDAAARTIQFHFRAFLLRRSRTLRQLKNLGSIKSTLSILKYSVSQTNDFDYDVVYERVMSLRRRLHSIQSGDTMIRDGKNSISRDLDTFLDSIDEYCPESEGVSGSVSVRYKTNNVVPMALNDEGEPRNLKSNLKKSRVLMRADEEELISRMNKLSEYIHEETYRPVIRKHGAAGKSMFLNRSDVDADANQRGITFGGIEVVNAKNADPRVVNGERKSRNLKKSTAMMGADEEARMNLARRINNLTEVIHENTGRPFIRKHSADADGKQRVTFAEVDVVNAREKCGLFREVGENGVYSKTANDDDDDNGEEAHSKDGDSHQSSDGGEE